MKISNYKGSIQNKLTLMIFSITSVIMIVGYSVFIVWYFNNQEEKNITLAKQMTHVISQDIAKLVLLDDVSTAADISMALKSFPNIYFMVLYNDAGVPIYKYVKEKKTLKINKLLSSRESQREGNLLTFYTDVHYYGKKLGRIVFILHGENFWDILKNDAFVMFLLYLASIFFSYVLALFYSKQFTKPIRELVNFLEKIDMEHSLEKRVVVIEQNEFGKLYEEVNSMLEKLSEANRVQKIAAVAFETPTGMMIMDAKQVVLQSNQAFTNMTGYLLEEVIGKDFVWLQKHLHIEIQKARVFQKTLKKSDYWSGEITYISRQEQLKYAFISLQKVYNEKQTVTHFVLSFLDTTEKEEVQKELSYMKQYDSLTGFANKRFFLESLQKKLENELSQSWHLLLCFDIKDFKIINDVYGYAYGDRLLQEIAKRVKDDFSESDLIAKIGIDEFILCYRNLDKEEEKALIKAKEILTNLVAIMSEPFDVQGNNIRLFMRIGVNLYKNEIRDADIILKQANSALQTAKENDVEYAFFNKTIEEQSRHYISIYEELVRAIKGEQFEIYYQLQYKEGGEIYGAEALIRWNHPEKGLVAPNEFIPVSEKTDLILSLGLWVLEEGCRQLALWSKDVRTKDWILAVNVSAKQFHQKEFVSQIKAAVSKNNIPYNRLKIELLESLLVKNMQSVIAKMQELHSLGVQISLDDFGTGYSSLQYIKNLPIDQIKIDQSFIFTILQDKKNLAIAKAIITLGNDLGLDVIAEGVETKEHYEVLKSLSCHFFQGYYFAKPQSIAYINEHILNKDK